MVCLSKTKRCGLLHQRFAPNYTQWIRYIQIVFVHQDREIECKYLVLLSIRFHRLSALRPFVAYRNFNSVRYKLVFFHLCLLLLFIKRYTLNILLTKDQLHVGDSSFSTRNGTHQLTHIHTHIGAILCKFIWHGIPADTTLI